MSALDPDPREQKLPRWAQQSLQILRRDLKHWRGMAEAGPPESNTYLHGYTERGEPAGTPLGMDAEIRFELDGERYIFARIDRGQLALHGTDRSMGELSIRPRSTNMANVDIGR